MMPEPISRDSFKESLPTDCPSALDGTWFQLKNSARRRNKEVASAPKNQITIARSVGNGVFPAPLANALLQPAMSSPTPPGNIRNEIVPLPP